MSCEFCSKSPCVCGEEYKRLTDDWLLNLIFILQKEAKSRNLDVNVKVGETILETYLANNTSSTNSESWLNKLTTAFIPRYYHSFLREHMGEKCYDVVDKFKESEDILKFPLLMLFYLNSDTEPFEIIHGLTNILINYFSGNYNGQLLLRFCDKLNKAKTFNEFRSILNELITNLVQMGNAIDHASVKTEFNRTLAAVTNLIALVERPDDAIASSIKLMLTTSSNTGYDIKHYIADDGKEIKNWLVDELFNADYAMTRTFIQEAHFKSDAVL